MAWLRLDLVRQCLHDFESPETALLEIGCGLGATGARLAQRFDYLGVDSDEASATVARERLASIGAGRVRHSSFDMIDDSRQFDVVCAFEVLEHVEDDAGALKHWRSLLRPGGRLVLSVPAYQSKFGPVDDLVGHYRRYDPDRLTSLLKGSGFDGVTLRMYGYPIGYLTRPVQSVLARRRVISDSRETRTAGSGRFLQPASPWQGAVTAVVAAPFRVLQRVAPAQHRGSGLVVSARARG
jgi:SAM-dependent methyltransferase